MSSMLAAEDENDNEVRREDQENINRFARLNARLTVVRNQRDELKKDLEHLDDASTDLMMSSEDNVMLVLGDAYLEVSENEATEYCEKQVDILQAKVTELQKEEEEILKEQASLKSVLYGRFGKSINLET
jgi:prefoldin subunit 4